MDYDTLDHLQLRAHLLTSFPEIIHLSVCLTWYTYVINFYTLAEAKEASATWPSKKNY